MVKPLEKERLDSLLVYRLSGDLSSYVLDLLKTELVLDVKETGICRVLINLQDIDYITSSDLGLFVQIYHYLDAQSKEKACPEPAEREPVEKARPEHVEGVELIFTNLTPFVLDVIHMTRLDTVFKVFKSEKEAIKKLTGE